MDPRTIIIILLIILIIIHLFNPSCGALWGCCLTEPMAPVNNTRVVTLHYTSWCPACKIMKPVWEQVKVATANSGIVFKEIDEETARTPGVFSYPTIRMITEHGRMVEYHGTSNFVTLRNWTVSPIMPD